MPRLRIRAPQDFGAAVVFFAIGLAGLYFSAKLGVMRPGAQLGSGSLPRALCWILLGFGVVMALRAFLVDGPPVEGVSARGAATVTLAILLFGAMIERVGYVPAAVAAPLIASAATRAVRWREAVWFAVALAAGASLLFITLLGQPLRYFGGP